MEGEDKERNRLLLVKLTYKHYTKLFSKTHQLMLETEGTDMEKNRLLMVKLIDHSVKLTC